MHYWIRVSIRRHQRDKTPSYAVEWAAHDHPELRLVLLELRPEEVEALRSQAQEIRATNSQRAGLGHTMQQHGAHLFDWLGKDADLRGALSRCVDDGRGRIELEIHDPDLHNFVWELMCRRREIDVLPGAIEPSRPETTSVLGVEYLLHRNVSVVRMTADRVSRGSWRTITPIVNVLVVLAAPMSADVPADDGSGDRVRQRLDGFDRLRFVDALNASKAAVGEEAFDFRRCNPPTYENLAAAVRSGAYNVLYFIGHCCIGEGGSKSYLILEDGTSSGRGISVSSDDLKQLLHGSSIRLVVLSACDTARSEARTFLAGMAQAVADVRCIQAVVGMQIEVPVYTAEAFDVAFFSELACLGDVCTAVASGRDAIVRSLVLAGEDKREIADWAIPVVFNRSDLADGFHEDTAEVLPGKYHVGLDAGDLRALQNMGAPELVLSELKGKQYALRPVQVHHSFRIARWPVTNQLYKRFLGATGHGSPEGWRREGAVSEVPLGKATHPVVNISVNDAVAFCSWQQERTGRKVRLPSADEWEVAARGPHRHLYPWGPFDRARCNLRRSHTDGTTSVFKFPAGRNDLGMWDAIGNVWEWTSTEMDHKRVVLGGCWHSDQLQALPSVRNLKVSSGRFANVGFRYVVE